MSINLNLVSYIKSYDSSLVEVDYDIVEVNSDKYEDLDLSSYGLEKLNRPFKEVFSDYYDFIKDSNLQGIYNKALMVGVPQELPLRLPILTGYFNKILVEDKIVLLVKLPLDITKIEYFDKDNNLLGEYLIPSEDQTSSIIVVNVSSVNGDSDQFSRAIHEDSERPHINLFRDILSTLDYKKVQNENSTKLNQIVVDERSSAIIANKSSNVTFVVPTAFTSKVTIIEYFGSAVTFNKQKIWLTS